METPTREQAWSLPGHPTELSDAPRRFEVYAALPTSGVGAGTGLMLLNLGLANDPSTPFFRKMRIDLSNRYDCVCVGVSYSGTAAKRSRTLQMTPPSLRALLNKVPGPLRTTLTRESPVPEIMQALRGQDLQGLLISQEALPDQNPSDFFDFGPAQAMDVSWGVRDVQETFSLRRDRCFSVGSSLAGFVSLLADKLDPGLFSAIFDISAPVRIPRGRFIKGGRAPFILDRHNTTATLVCDNLFTEEPGLPNSLTDARLALRNVADPAHLGTSTAALRVLHGIQDRVVTTQEKKSLVETAQSLGRDATLDLIGPEAVDGKVVLHAGHGLGANFHGLVRSLADRWCEPGTSHELRHAERRPPPPTLRLEAAGGAWLVDHTGPRPLLTRQGSA